VPEGTFAIGTVTRLMPSKGNQYLVEAAKAVFQAVPQARIYIVGEGELQPELEAQARSLGVGDRLVFAGFRRDVAQVLAALDLLVFPSLWEGTPLTVLEALAMGKPIVATDADGLQDVLTNGVDAMMVPRRDPTSLAQAMIGLAHNARERERLSANARKTGAAYDIALFVRKMERLYELLVQTSRATRRAGILQQDLSFLVSGRTR
jgi:glycosyltransferase involved in cell wall biosynthesis